jgi:2-C-methyl-D-erythritol 2,4-cyclodiphosphate synthase
LGAAGLGDIGRHFPDSDPDLRNIDSRFLLRKVMILLRRRRLAVNNADLTVIAQAPKLAPHIPRMIKHIAADLGVATGQVNVKATTTEGLGYLGRGEGIAAHAVVLLHETSLDQR